jgi:hypothetical protein
MVQQRHLASGLGKHSDVRIFPGSLLPRLTVIQRPRGAFPRKRSYEWLARVYNDSQTFHLREPTTYILHT